MIYSTIALPSNKKYFLDWLILEAFIVTGSYLRMDIRYVNKIDTLDIAVVNFCNSKPTVLLNTPLSKFDETSERARESKRFHS